MAIIFPSAILFRNIIFLLLPQQAFCAAPSSVLGCVALCLRRKTSPRISANDPTAINAISVSGIGSANRTARQHQTRKCKLLTYLATVNFGTRAEMSHAAATREGLREYLL